jgi:hypothetical protein
LVTHFYVDESTPLPTGLTIDETTGIVSGTVTEIVELMQINIFAENPAGVTVVEVSISSREAECKPDGVFPKIKAGETFIYECSSAGSYIGTQTRECVIGTEDGEWKDPVGSCYSISFIVFMVVIVIVIILVILFILIRLCHKTKSVGGIKGKKLAKNEKSTDKRVKL